MLNDLLLSRVQILNRGGGRTMSIRFITPTIFWLCFAVASMCFEVNPVAAGVLLFELQVEEHQPEIPYSGRVNAVAVNPNNRNHALAATESGGLFESRNGGISWHHVDTLPAMNLRDVLYLTYKSTEWILVTAEADFRNRVATGSVARVTTSNGGIWISRDGGATWSHPDSAVPRANRLFFPPDDRSCPPNVSAYGAAYDVDSARVFVATDCGVSYSDDTGLTWTHKSVRLGLNADTRRFHTVAALDGAGVIVGGRAGVWYSTDNGSTWTRETTGIGVVIDSHAVGAVRGRAGRAYIVTFDTDGTERRRLWQTQDLGQTWTSIGGVPRNSPGCGGIAHVRAFPNETARVGDRLFGNVDHLYFGNACYTYYHPLSGWGATVKKINWTKLNGSHADTRGIFFRPGTTRPMFLASDGGLDRVVGWNSIPDWPMPMLGVVLPVWAPIGSGPEGINALQLYSVSGQAVFGASEYRLAIGTQDNYLWSSDDDGHTWPEAQSTPAEGGNIQMRRIISPGDEDKWTFSACAPCARKISDALFQNVENWAGYTSRPGCSFGGTGKVSDSRVFNGYYIHRITPERDDDGLTDCAEDSPVIDMTLDFGNTYSRLFSVPDEEELKGGPKLSGGHVYNAIKRGTYSTTATNGFDGTWNTRDTELVRITWHLLFPPSARYPAMNRFGSLGVYGFNFAWPAVLGVNPHDPRHLIAPDVENDQMMLTVDGGEEWIPIPGLVNKITRSGLFNFSWSRRLNNDVVFSLVSAIEFFPENPELVIMGLQQGGIYLSVDRGLSWNFVPGSERINNITDFHWKSANEIYVASFGRGLWKIQYGVSANIGDLTSVLAGNVTDSDFVNGIELSSGLVLVPIKPGYKAGEIRLDERGIPVPLLQALLAKDQLLDTVALAVEGKITGLTKGLTINERVQRSAGASLLVFSQHPDVVDQGLEKPDSGQLLTEPPILNTQDLVVTPGNGELVPVGVGYRNGETVGVILGPVITYERPALEPVEFPAMIPKNPPGFKGGYVTFEPSGTNPLDGDAYTSQDVLYLRGHAFDSSDLVDIFIDDQLNPVVGGIQPGQAEEFTTVLPLKGLAIGEHRLVARERVSGWEDERTIYITHFENGEDEEVE